MSKVSTFVCAERPHDYFYDPLFIASSGKDLEKAARLAERRVAQTRFFPRFQQMFSELPHFPSTSVIHCTAGQVPCKINACNRNQQRAIKYCDQIIDLSSQVVGVDRYKYFTSALEPLEDNLEEYIPSLIRLAPVPCKARIAPSPINISPLRGSLMEPHSSEKLYKSTGAQTLPITKHSQKEVGASNFMNVGGSKLDEILTVKQRTEELKKANNYRMELARKLREDHSEQSERARKERRAKIDLTWFENRTNKLTKLLSFHNREIRKLKRTFGNKTQTMIDKEKVRNVKLNCKSSINLALPSLLDGVSNNEPEKKIIDEPNIKNKLSKCIPMQSPWAPTDLIVSRRNSHF